MKFNDASFALAIAQQVSNWTMQTQPIEGHLSPELAQMFLEGLPAHIRRGLESRAQEINYPVWAVIEMAIAGFLDDEALGFLDCKPERGQSVYSCRHLG